LQNFLETNSYSKFDEIFIPGLALAEGKLYKKALKKVEELIPILKENKNNREYYSFYYFLKGMVLRGLKRYDRSKDMLIKATEQEGYIHPEAYYTIPYSYVELAELEMDNNNFSQAQNILLKAKTYKGYDWERVLTVRISSLLQKVEKRMKE